MNKTDKQRFIRLAKPKGADECWPWGGTKRNKYGGMKIAGKTMLAHRVSYQLHKGTIPPGLLVCHSCDNPPCVNPAHLFIGTQRDNLADRAKKGRFNPVNGERHGRSKLKEADVVAILADSRKQSEIAAEYGVDRAMISHIKRGHSWRHVPR